MSAVAPAATPPPAVSGVSEGRAKRKISKPNRFTLPRRRSARGPTRPRQAPSSPRPRRSLSRVDLPRPAGPNPRRFPRRGPRPGEEAGCLSPSQRHRPRRAEPRRRGLIGQSPVPESAVVEAMAAAAAAREITSPGSGALAGLAMLLEAEESPTLARDLGVAANMLPKGSRPRQNPAASPLRPVNLNAAGDDGTRRHPTAPDAPAADGATAGRWQATARRRRQGQGGRGRGRGSIAGGEDQVGPVAAPAAERAR